MEKRRGHTDEDCLNVDRKCKTLATALFKIKHVSEKT